MYVPPLDETEIVYLLWYSHNTKRYGVTKQEILPKECSQAAFFSPRLSGKRLKLCLLHYSVPWLNQLLSSCCEISPQSNNVKQKTEAAFEGNLKNHIKTDAPSMDVKILN